MNRLMSFTLLVCLILIGLPEKQAHLQSRHGLVTYDVPFTCWKCKCHLALLGDLQFRGNRYARPPTDICPTCECV
ncbi:unnamed protein product, partial [Schistosoma rodhaini]|uniref:Uncharacterized protein n=1 Tax=Schistosoma rodhaini TaxID=6188 RepID=A0AA85FGX3_9TREM